MLAVSNPNTPPTRLPIDKLTQRGGGSCVSMYRRILFISTHLPSCCVVGAGDSIVGRLYFWYDMGRKGGEMMTVNEKGFDREKIMHGVATAFAQVDLLKALEKDSERYSSPQERAAFLVESYCEMLGYCETFKDDYLESLISKEMPRP